MSASSPSERPRARRNSSGTFARVLVVDDDDAVRRALSRVLGSRGFLVDMAADGAEALALAETGSYPLVLTDLSMPGIDGFSLIREMHRLSADTVFVLLTGHTEVEIPEDPSFRECIASVLSKPFEIEDLVGTMHRSLRLFESRCAARHASDKPALDCGEILLLEDTDSDAELIEAYLNVSQCDAHVTRARRLSDALDLLRSQNFGLIIADLSLPDARGLDSVMRVQNLALDTPLVVMTGLEDRAVALQAMQAGAQDVLLKREIDGPGLMRAIQFAKERKLSEQSLTQLAYHDPLTGLANRTKLKDQLSQTLARSQRSGQSFALAFIDLDGFKPINDTLGHAAGDALLVGVSRRLESTVREYDTVARLGGDEFAVILDNLVNAHEAERVACRMLDAIAEPYALQQGTANVTASIGLALFPEAGTTIENLLNAADLAMYEVKSRGRGGFATHRPATVLHEQRDDQTEPSEPLSLAYAPLYEGSRRRVVGMEAILESAHSNERSGARQTREVLEACTGEELAQTTAWYVEHAIDELTRWRCRDNEFCRLTLKVSGPQLKGDIVHDAVQKTLAHTKVPARHIELEVRANDVAETTLPALRNLKYLGVRIAIDQVGMAGSPFLELLDLPVDTFKLDRSLAHRDQSKVLGAIVAMARHLGIDVIATGVENESQRKLLEKQGCRLFQGLATASPKAATEDAPTESRRR